MDLQKEPKHVALNNVRYAAVIGYLLPPFPPLILCTSQVYVS